MKILLCYLCDWKERHDYYISLVPYGLTSIAAYLESRKHDVILANYSSYGYRKAAQSAASEKPDIIGVSLFSFNRHDSLLFIREVRPLLPNAKIVVGGPHASFLSGELLKRYPEIDAVIEGEGEEVFLEYVDSLERGVHQGNILKGKRITDIDSLPNPSLFRGKTPGINKNEQYKVIITSRGCPNDCTFCSSPAFWSRRVTFRSAESIVDEIEYVHKKYGIIYFSIRDDNFTLRKDRVLTVSQMLKERSLYLMWNCQARVDSIDLEMLVAMKRSGLEHIQYGVESGSPRILKRYNKAINLDGIVRAAAMTREQESFCRFT